MTTTDKAKHCIKLSSKGLSSDPTTVTEIAEAYLDMKEAYEHVCKDCDREHGIVIAKIARIQELEAANAELVEALDKIQSVEYGFMEYQSLIKIAREALAKHRGGEK